MQPCATFGNGERFDDRSVVDVQRKASETKANREFWRWSQIVTTSKTLDSTMNDLIPAKDAERPDRRGQEEVSPHLIQDRQRAIVEMPSVNIRGLNPFPPEVEADNVPPAFSQPSSDFI